MRNLLEAVSHHSRRAAPEAYPSASSRSRHSSSLRKAIRTALLVSCVPVILAACGSSPAAGSSTSSTTAKSSGTASLTAYTNCLKQHGVTLPNFPNGSGGPPTGGSVPSGTPPSFGSGGSPPAGGNFANNPKFQKAAAACKSLRPSGSSGFGGPGGSGGFNSSAFAAYRNCLKLHGVTLPTGTPQGSASSTPSTTLSQSSPTVKAALQACAALQPSASTTTTTG